MTSTLTGTDVFNELLSRWTFLGWAATADSIPGDGLGLIDVSEFAHTGFGDEEMKDKYLNRYEATDPDDEVKIITTIDNATGEAFHGGIAYTDLTHLAYRVLIVHPSIIYSAIASAMQRMYSTTHVLLSTYTDGDMELSNVNYWDGTSGGSLASGLTPTKDNDYVGSGTQALKLTGAAGSVHRCRGEQIWLTGGQSIYSCHNVLVESGTLTIRLYNATSGQYVGTADSFTDRNFMMSERNDTAPTGGLYQYEYSLASASDIAWIDATSGPRPAGKMKYNLPAWMDTSYKVRFIRPSLYEVAIPNSTGQRAWDSESRYFTGDWQQPQDFWLETFHREAHPNSVNFTKLLPQVPIWIAAERKLSETEPLTTETSTTTEDMNKIQAYVQADLALALRALDQDNTFYQALVKETVFEESLELLARTELPQVVKRGMRTVRV